MKEMKNGTIDVEKKARRTESNTRKEMIEMEKRECMEIEKTLRDTV